MLDSYVLDLQDSVLMSLGVCSPYPTKIYRLSCSMKVSGKLQGHEIWWEIGDMDLLKIETGAVAFRPVIASSLHTDFAH